jgi:hypothetical protein
MNFNAGTTLLPISVVSEKQSLAAKPQVPQAKSINHNFRLEDDFLLAKLEFVTLLEGILMGAWGGPLCMILCSAAEVLLAGCGTDGGGAKSIGADCWAIGIVATRSIFTSPCIKSAG